MFETHNPTIIFGCRLSGGNDSIAQRAPPRIPSPSSPRSRQPCRDISAKYRKPITDLARRRLHNLLHARGSAPDFTVLTPIRSNSEGGRSSDGREKERRRNAVLHSTTSRILPACPLAFLPSFAFR